jgi:hypothetical protein
MKLARSSFGALVAGVVVAAMFALPGVAAAAPSFTAAQEAESTQIRALLTEYKKSAPKVKPFANPGEVCNTINEYMVVDNYYGEIEYIVPPNTAMRIEAYAGASLYYGHQQYHENGYFLRNKINQSSCHKT